MKKVQSKTANETKKLGQTLEELREIVQWFDNNEDVDLEKGMKKVRDGAKLLKEAKAHLKEIDNEFKEIEKLLE